MIFELLTFEQLRLVCVIYTSSIVPLLLIPYLYKRKKISLWVLQIYIILIIICALGWELWFTYGWVAGDNVNLRRAPILSTMLPLHINWLLNSLADAGTICFEDSTSELVSGSRSFVLQWQRLFTNSCAFETLGKC